jgi:GWxTD domain-containing protein
MVMLALLPALLPARGARRAAQEPAVEAGEAEAIRWLLLPAEERDLRRAVTEEERARLLQRFWSRRQAEGEEEGEIRNRTLFLERMRAADVLYGDEAVGTVGSLTQRGRALILLGTPHSLEHSYERSPRWDPGLWQRRQAGTRPVQFETWGYRPEDLTPELRRELADRGWPFELRLRFIIRNGRGFVMEGEPFLEAAARSFLRRER